MDSLHLGRLAKICKTPSRSELIFNGQHVLERKIFKFVKKWKLIRKICGCSAVAQDLIVTAGCTGFVHLIHRQLRRINLDISRSETYP